MARTYGHESCPVARTLDAIGERWTMLILRDLFLHGPRRFQDFQESLGGLAPNTLSARLKDLEARAWSPAAPTASIRLGSSTTSPRRASRSGPC